MMKSLHRGVVGSIVLGFGLCFVHAQAAGAGGPCGAIDPIRSFDLVAPGTGWAASLQHLYWTADDGRRWREITPLRVRPDELIQVVYFADRQHGWVPLMSTFQDQPPRLQVAMTRNGGTSWSYVEVDLTHVDYVLSAPPGIASMSFSDRMHGWMLIDASSSQLSRRGYLFRTMDGGTHWKLLPIPPIDGGISFGSARNGVLTDALNPYSDAAVWHTKDGGRTWTASSLPLPESCPKCVVDQISRAFFYDAGDAMLTAIIRPPEIDDFVSVEYGTTDGGATWSVNGRSPPQTSNAGGELMVVADGHTVGLNAARHNLLLLNIDEKNFAVTLPADVSPGAIDKLSVASNLSVWALSTYPHADLLSIDPRSGSVRRVTPTKCECGMWAAGQ
jgi:photosystem II stability/assembly factor-like uncharacterized protein